jgi:hypothetical protein
MHQTATPFYRFVGVFDRAKFDANMRSEFAAEPRFSATHLADARTLLAVIESDPLIDDIRWMAYMLATAFWETTYPSFKEVAVVNKKTHKPVLGANGAPVTKKIIVSWRATMSPVDEYGFGKGKAGYYLPVKVMKLPDGSARVTENDGDQWTVNLEGKEVAVTKRAKMGSANAGASAKTYLDDPGKPLKYFGRGYVQLTWWLHYAAAGVALGRGLELLFEPELVKQPAVAYALMSHGMRTGHGFANGRRFAHYFSSKLTNYRGARAMVNGSNHAADIAALAKKFETVLLKSKCT